MLPLLALVTHRAVAQPASWGRLAAQCATHFFLPGVTAVLVLIASGLGNTSWMIDSVSDLAGTGYGRVLSVKLGLFALMLVLACVNRLVTVPRIGHAPNAPRALRSLRLSVLAELVLGAAILAVVAWLGVTPPAAHEHTMHRMQTM
jgi:putative copper resistance protein D